MQIVLCCLIWRVAAFVLVYTEKPPGGAERATESRIEKSIIQTQKSSRGATPELSVRVPESNYFNECHSRLLA